MSAGEPFRLDGAAVTHGKPFPFTFAGTAYVLPAITSWPVTALTAALAGRMEDALAGVLGEAATARLTDDGITLGHMVALFEQAAKGVGGDGD